MATTTVKERSQNKGLSVRGQKVVATLFSKKAVGPKGDGIESSMKSYNSLQLTDPFETIYSSTISGTNELAPIQPPFSLNRLIKVPQENNTLKQCIDVYVVNIESFGYMLEYIGEKGKEGSVEARREKTRIEDLLDQPNGETTLTVLRERCRADHEAVGFSFLEVGRDAVGSIVLVQHIPAHTMRLTKKLPEEVQVTRTLTRDGRMVNVKVKKRFRRYVQLVGTDKVYFKEFGDPRSISPKTGLVDNNLKIEDQATEVLYFSQYVPGHTYGLPRWINQLPAILGSRESELTNLQFFRDNAIPAMAVLVSGGGLSEESMSQLTERFSSGNGRESINRVLVLEALGDEDAANDETGQVPVPKIDIKPLANERQNDALFQEYDKNNATKVRSSFRLPPLFLGLSQEYSHATAAASVLIAEAQVFGPERRKVDTVYNLQLLQDKDGEAPKYWRFKSKAPKLGSVDEIMKALDTLQDSGAIAPNDVITIVNDMFDLMIDPIGEKWGGLPFSIVLEMVRNGKQFEGLTYPAGETPPEEEKPVAVVGPPTAEDIPVPVTSPVPGEE